MKQSWSLIILAYNEKESIKAVVGASEDVLKLLSNDYEIIIIDDGSSDGTSEIVKGLASDKIIVHKNIKNKGIGPSLRTGYNLAQKENVLMVPGDGQFDINELLPFQNIPEDTIIAFYRNTKGQQYNLYRDTLSMVNKMMNRFLLGLRMKDVNWVKIYKNSNLKSIDIQVKSSLIESEICAKLSLRVTIKHFESKYLKRIGGVGKGSSFKIVTKAMIDTLALIWYVNIYKLQNLFGHKTGNKPGKAAL